jgi:hypothetical protein
MVPDGMLALPDNAVPETDFKCAFQTAESLESRRVATYLSGSPAASLVPGAVERFSDGPLDVLSLPAFPALVGEIARSEGRFNFGFGGATGRRI